MVEMRRENRENTISKRRYAPSGLATEDDGISKPLDMSHLQTVPWGMELKSKIDEMLIAKVDPNNL